MGQAFDVRHQLTLQQKSDDREEEEDRRKVEESEAVPGCSSTHTHRHTRRFGQLSWTQHVEEN